ncbi:hypothetical protein A9Q84_00870 [Halobacteriovorax marinus]|uniref:Uncharacterized protein n=1 Tax=Halobacteriovorax marinus TaxID=97084 RepID=A0A1Y5FHE2_9BACT|nr:hypothetical protein A9Q84_00870 [Halobacteriovorax marinus]
MFFIAITLSGLLYADSKKIHLTEKEAFDLGMSSFKKKKYIQSLQFWNYLCEKNSKKGVYFFNRGNVYFSLQDYQAALLSYRRVLEVDSELSQVAALYMSKCYKKLGKFSTAKLTLRSLLKSQDLRPTVRGLAQEEVELIKEAKKSKDREQKSIPLEFVLGLKYFKQQKYVESIANLELASKSYSSPELYLIKGICYFKLNNNKLAKVNLRLAAKKSSDPDIISNASALMSLIKQKESEVVAVVSPWNITLGATLDYTTNPLNVTEVDTGSKESQYSLSFGLGYDFIVFNGFRISPNYDLSFDQSFKTSDDRFVEHVGSLSLLYFGNLGYIKLLPSFTKQDSGKKPYLTKSGGSFSGNINYLKFFSTSLSFVTSQNNPESIEQSYLNGKSNSLSISETFSTEKFSFSASLSLTKDQFQDEADNVLSKKATGASLGLYFYPLEVFTISTSLNYLREVYKEDSSSGFIRKNTQTSLSLGLTYDLTKKVNIFFNSNLSIDDGNLDTQTNEVGVSLTDDLYEFDEQVSIGITWYIL